eukprot:CFRG0702T1
MVRKKSGSYFVDPQLLPRVQAYSDDQVTENGLSLQSREAYEMVLRNPENVMDHMIRKFPRDYARKNKQVLVRSINKAITIVCRNAGTMRVNGNELGESEGENAGDLVDGEIDMEEAAEEEADKAFVAAELKMGFDSNIMEDSHSNEEDSDDMKNGYENDNDNLLSVNGKTKTKSVLDNMSDASVRSTRENSVDIVGSVGEQKQQKRSRSRVSVNNVAPKRARVRERVGSGGSGKGLGGKISIRPSARYSDIAGIEAILQDVRELIEYPLTHPEIYVHLGIEPPRGILLHGLPGTGKTLLANAIAGELGVSFLKISAPEVVSGMSGESEAKIRELFDQAKELAPAIIFIDEIDAIAPKRENAQREMERRMVAQLLTSMDDVCMENTTNNAPVIIIGATNRPDSLDPALRRAGRFDREICLGAPDRHARARILSVLCAKLRLSGEIDMEKLGGMTAGFVGADLAGVTREAAVLAVHRIFSELYNKDSSKLALEDAEVIEKVKAATVVVEGTVACKGVDESEDWNTLRTTYISLETPIVNADGNIYTNANKNNNNRMLEERVAVSDQLRKKLVPLTEKELEPLAVTMSDFELAVKQVQPSAKREGFATVPDVTWDDIGALDTVRLELRMAILEPIRNPQKFEAVGLNTPAGVLLYGPPGCGKTLLAKAIASESGTSFISVKGPELLNKYVGESERSIRLVFQRARDSSPCVVFFDELDALCPRRGGESHASERVVNTLLTEMDGLETRKNVFVIAATNRPDMIDPAMLRPGRLDKLLYVDLPTAADRVGILKTITRKTPLGPDVVLAEIANDKRCEGFSGADLASLVREATVATLRDSILHGKDHTPIVGMEHFNFAFENTYPSVTEKDMRTYSSMQRKLRSARGKLNNKLVEERASGKVSSDIACVFDVTINTESFIPRQHKTGVVTVHHVIKNVKEESPFPPGFVSLHSTEPVSVY